MKTIKIAALALGLAVAGSANAATNLITNGSFEAGAVGVGPAGFTAWNYNVIQPGNALPQIIKLGPAAPYPTGAYGEAVPIDAGFSGSPDAVGEQAAYFVGDAAKEELSQTVFLNVGQYTIGFSAYVPFNGFGNRFNASFTGAVADVPLANFTVDDSTPGVWKHYFGIANVTTAGNYTTKFTFESGAFPAGDVVIDRAYIVAGAIPEPGAWALMILGFGAAGTALRANRRRVAAA